MKVGLILAAGKGSRLGSEKLNTHKGLIKVANIPIIFRLINQMLESGINDFLIVVGYNRELLEEALICEFPQIDFNFVNNGDFETTNNVYSLNLGLRELSLKYPNSTAVLAECDVVLADSAARDFLNLSDGNYALVSPYGLGMDGTVVKLDFEKKSIKEMILGSKQGLNFDFSETYKTVNLYIFETNFWRIKLLNLFDWYISSYGVNSYYENVIGVLLYSSDEVLKPCVIAPTTWIEIDDQNDLRRAEFLPGLSETSKSPEVHHGGFWESPLIDFIFIRNMYFPPADLIAQLKSYLSDAIWNYGSDQLTLDLRMSYFLDEPNSQRVLALPGLADIYPALNDFFYGKKVMIPSPTFGEYFKIPNHFVYNESAPIEELEVIIRTEIPDFVVLVNPNNPTGSLKKTSQIVDLSNTFPQVNFILDESFIDFSEEPSIMTFAQQFGENVLVLKSLSKVLGVPGLRLGFAWSKNLLLIGNLRKKQPIWAMNSLSEIFLSLLGKFRKELQNSIDRTMSDKRSLISKFEQVNDFKVINSMGGNFILVSLPELSYESSPLFKNEIIKNGFLIKDETSRLKSKYCVFRIAIRTEHENNDLFSAFSSVSRKFLN